MDFHWSVTSGNIFQASQILRTGLLTRLALMGLGGLSMLYARWRIMGTGPPAFTEVDNPASFADSIFLRVSKICFCFFVEVI